MGNVSLTHIGGAKEAAWGTSTVPTFWIPAKSVKSEPLVGRIVDNSRRGNASKDQASYTGTQKAKVSIESDFYQDHNPRIIAAVLGADTVTGVGPYTHTMVLGNTVPSHSWTDYDTLSGRRYAGALCSSVTLKWATEQGALEMAAEFESKMPTDVAETPPTFSTVAPWLGWQMSLTIAAAGNTDCIGGEVTIKRTPKLIYGGANSKDPNRGFALGDVEVTGRLTFYAADSVIRGYYTNNTQPAVVITFTDGTNVLTITMTKCDFEKVQDDRGDEYVKWDVTFRGIHNTTDGGPAKVVATNAVSAAYV